MLEKCSRPSKTLILTTTAQISFARAGLNFKGFAVNRTSPNLYLIFQTTTIFGFRNAYWPEILQRTWWHKSGSTRFLCFAVFLDRFSWCQRAAYNAEWGYIVWGGLVSWGCEEEVNKMSNFSCIKVRSKFSDKLWLFAKKPCYPSSNILFLMWNSTNWGSIVEELMRVLFLCHSSKEIDDEWFLAYGLN